MLQVQVLPDLREQAWRLLGIPGSRPGEARATWPGIRQDGGTEALMQCPDSAGVHALPVPPPTPQTTELRTAGRRETSEEVRVPQQWDTAVATGSQWVQTFAFPSTNITGLTWEFVVRVDTDDTGTPLIRVTQTAGTQGQIVVDTIASTVQVIITASATAAIGTGVYAHALWSNYGTDTANDWIAGIFATVAVARP